MTNNPPEDIERVARAAYEASCALDPIEPQVPNWGRGGFKTQIAYWEGIARAALNAMAERTDTAQIQNRVEVLTEALDLACRLLGDAEPPDSRAVSNEFVAMFSVLCGNENAECLEIIRAASAKHDQALPHSKAG